MASDSIMHYDFNDIDYNDYSDVNNSVKEAPVKRRYYTSNSPDSFIKNAITGVLYPYKVGSNDSRRLFKIVDTTGNYQERLRLTNIGNFGIGTSTPSYKLDVNGTLGVTGATTLNSNGLVLNINSINSNSNKISNLQ